MDKFGSVVREFTRKLHARNVANALSLAQEFKKESMSEEQIEEMLFASEFDRTVIADAMDELLGRNGK